MLVYEDSIFCVDPSGAWTARESENNCYEEIESASTTDYTRKQQLANAKLEGRRENKMGNECKMDTWGIVIE